LPADKTNRDLTLGSSGSSNNPDFGGDWVSMSVALSCFDPLTLKTVFRSLYFYLSFDKNHLKLDIRDSKSPHVMSGSCMPRVMRD
jgi:hypothetical protein